MRTERYIGLDYLRAFFSVCVVLVHLGYVSRSIIFSKDFYLAHTFTVSDFINFYLLLLAVPVFFLISNYLFYRKPQDSLVLSAYLKRIAKIAGFWIVLHIIFKYKGWDFIHSLPKSSMHLAYFIMSGGNTIYYFFISLIGLTVITHLCKRLNIFHVLVLFIITTLFVSILPVLSVKTGHYALIAYWSPLNFLPYPFAAILVFHIAGLDRAKMKPIYMIAAGFLILLLVVADWTIYINKGFFNVAVFALPAYARPSLVFIGMAALYCAVKLDFKGDSISLFMSNNSLALYCLHPFFILPAKRLSGGSLIFSLFLILIFSYSTAIIIKPFLKQELIR
jgi:peptidoglycan/LPS O-acetylase OafA/YrhL